MNLHDKHNGKHKGKLKGKLNQLMIPNEITLKTFLLAVVSCCLLAATSARADVNDRLLEQRLSELDELVREVTFTIDREALSYYDDTQSKWVAEPGKFEAIVAASATDIRSTVPFRLEE